MQQLIYFVNPYFLLTELLLLFNYSAVLSVCEHLNLDSIRAGSWRDRQYGGS